MAGIVHGGKFEQKMNELSSPNNIAATAKKFAELEKQHGPYSFGKFVKLFIREPDEIADWDKHSDDIPEPIRWRLAEIISTNLRSATPLPVVLTVGENADVIHDLIVKIFAHNGHIYIGILLLCPNTSLK
jgi:hypothetical protein